MQPVEAAAASLQAQLEQMRAERKQERYIWIMAVNALGFCLATVAVPGPAAAVLLVFIILELLVLARFLEVPWIVTHLERWFDRVSATKRSSETE